MSIFLLLSGCEKNTPENEIKTTKTPEDRMAVVESIKNLIKDYDKPNEKPITQKMLDDLL